MTNKKTTLPHNEQIIVGWREWVVLPELGIERIKAKVDTGAKTSALHAFDVKAHRQNGDYRVQFKIHPFQNNETTLLSCEANVHDQRWVSDSGGHRELRFVIKSTIIVGNVDWPIEITLTNRDTMGFRMLLGRSAMGTRLIVDPSQSFLTTYEMD